MKRIILYIFLGIVVSYAGELLEDANFKNGFHLLGNDDANIIPYSSESILRVEEEANAPATWRLAEWNSNSTLATYEDYNSWANDSSSIGWRWSNPSKSITVGFGRGSGDITFAINAKNDYNNLYSIYPDTGKLATGEYKNWWTHLLIEQVFNTPIPVHNNLVWGFDAKLVYWDRYRGKDANGNRPIETNVGEFVTYLLIRNKYNHDQQLWLGMTIFDTSSDGTSNYRDSDIHTNINIYKTGVPQVKSTWRRYEKDITALLSEALKAYNNSLPITIENAEIIAFNMGWEVRGLDVGTIAINNLTLHNYNQYDNINYKLEEPTNLKFSSIESNEAILNWNDNSNNENGFKIYKNENLIATLPKNTTSYEIKDLEPRTKYSFRIQAYNDLQVSDSVMSSFKTKDDYAWVTVIYYIINN